MFLFTTPSPPASPPVGTADPVTQAIRKGADATGSDFDYLLRTAKRESALDPSAKAPTSSATGLFQFIEQTWLGVVKSDGDRLGLAAESKAVVARQDGTFTVPDPEARQAILKLREEPEVASAMAGVLTRRNRDSLAAATGRDPSAGELYIAHVLGARGAADLISAAATNPTRPAASDFPEAARANRSIFFDRSGRARGAAEVYGVLAQSPTAPAPTATAGPTVARPAAADATAAADKPPAGIYGLFQTGARRGPLSDAVARIWRANQDGSRVARPSAVSFFPRSEGSAPRGDEPAVAISDATPAAAVDAPTPAVAPVSDRTASLPLPPIRPAFLSAARSGAGGAPIDLRSVARGLRP